MSDGTDKPVFHTAEVNSLLDLKSEYLKKKKEANNKPLRSGNVVNRTKNNIFSLLKKEKNSKNLAKDARLARDQTNKAALLEKEEERLNRQKILEEKSKIYERLSNGEAIVYEDGSKADFLVDFHLKKRELENKHDAEFLQQSTSKYEENEKPETPLIVHYDHFEEKGRVFGASHVLLGTTDEDERLKNIQALKNMSAETTINRQKQKSALFEHKTAQRNRLNRIRARKGLPLVLSSSSEEDNDEPTINLDVDKIPLPPSEMDTKKQQVDERKLQKFGVEREWDRGKVMAGYQKWITDQRNDRNEEFRPPSSYYAKK